MIWRSSATLAGIIGALLFINSYGVAAAKDKWVTAKPEELEGTASTFEPGVVAEALLWRIEVDDREFPQNRSVEEYLRYKVYDPEKAEKILRLSQESYSYDGMNLREAEMSARLTLPDGTTKVFGAEALRERDVVKNANADSFLQRFFGSEGLGVKEKFMAIGGVLPGSILEVRVKVTEKYPGHAGFRSLQMDAIPVRKLEYEQHVCEYTENYGHYFAVVNSTKLVLDEDRNHTLIHVTGRDLPSLHAEPFSGAKSFFAATAVSCYTTKHYHGAKQTTGTQRHFAANQPWAPIATIENWIVEDQIDLTAKVKERAAALTTGATGGLEKARRIHDFVEKQYLSFTRWRKKNHLVLRRTTDVVSMNDLLDFEHGDASEIQGSDFLWLDVSLLRASGIPAEVLMLPNRKSAMFNPKVVSIAYLPNRCAAINLDGGWHFSMPNTGASIPFDELPWEFCGSQGLLARDGKQDFIDVPLLAPEKSAIENTGVFQLDAEGALTGDCTMVFSGYEADAIRRLLLGRSPERRIAVTKSNITRMFEGAEISAISLGQIVNLHRQIEINYRLRWPGYGTMADDRMIIRPFIFHSKLASPFSSSDRQNDLFFPFQRVESDKVTLTLPDGYELEVKEAPPSLPGKLLSYQVTLGLDKKHHNIVGTREFFFGLTYLPAADYPRLKQWFDATAESDQHNLVLKKISTDPVSSPAS